MRAQMTRLGLRSAFLGGASRLAGSAPPPASRALALRSRRRPVTAATLSTAVQVAPPTTPQGGESSILQSWTVCHQALGLVVMRRGERRFRIAA